MPSALLALISLIVLAPLAGCTPHARDPLPPPAPRTSADVSLDLAARHLGLHVVRVSPWSARLQNGQNVVYLMAEPNPGVLVNGQRIDPGWRIRVEQGSMVMPADLVVRIRAHLRPTSAPTIASSTPPTPPTPPTYPALPRTPPRMTVLIDPGHGGDDPGALWRFGNYMHEKDIVLDTSLRLRDAIQRQGIHVVMTRETDVFVSLDERVEIANRLRPDLVVSVHADAAANSEAMGHTVYIAHQASPASELAARAVADALRPHTLACRDVRRADFRVVAKTHSPAMLVELGYLTNPQEARQLATTSHRQRLAEAIASGVSQYLAQAPQGADRPSVRASGR